jgi:hypothetical protein
MYAGYCSRCEVMWCWKGPRGLPTAMAGRRAACPVCHLVLVRASARMSVREVGAKLVYRRRRRECN